MIVAIPYTSIIEQNAEVYRLALGQENVIEHHANLDPDAETIRNRLASENWDAPVVVTTNVQLLESLFANRPSRCRKVHNISGSVVLLDEVQTLPTRHLDAIVEVLQELTDSYGCSLVLSTATQPALVRSDSLPRGLRSVHEIVPNPPSLFARLRRVEVDWSGALAPEVSWSTLAAEISRHEVVLVVVHRRRDARELAELLPEERRFHLSALMCAAHRARTLEQIHQRLQSGGPCRVVSTQLIEAGVDVDFPVVYRALGGLDSIAQAAGRCNREGKLAAGRVIVFRSPTPPPAGTLRKGLERAESLLRAAGGALDLADPDLYATYFRVLYLGEDLDAAGVQAARQALKFATVARKLRLIEDGFAYPIVVPWGDGEQRLEALRRMGPSRERLRELSSGTSFRSMRVTSGSSGTLALLRESRGGSGGPRADRSLPSPSTTRTLVLKSVSRLKEILTR